MNMLPGRSLLHGIFLGYIEIILQVYFTSTGKALPTSLP